MIRFRAAGDYDLIPLEKGDHYLEFGLHEFPLFVRKNRPALLCAGFLALVIAMLLKQAADGKEIAHLSRQIEQKKQLMEGRLVSDLPSRRRKEETI